MPSVYVFACSTIAFIAVVRTALNYFVHHPSCVIHRLGSTVGKASAWNERGGGGEGVGVVGGVGRGVGGHGVLIPGMLNRWHKICNLVVTSQVV